MILDTDVLRQKTSSRGGGVEISLTRFGYADELMSAYQNYLGGGMLGKIANSCTIGGWETDETLSEIATALGKYYYDQTQSDQSQDYEATQRLSVSAY